jgi:catechol 2,3-dioxygenase-like lactoylglutathione lyase family enzyme
MTTMKTLIITAMSALTLTAQLPAPNEAGVAMGHLHLNSKDPETHKKFWIDYMGGKAAKLGNFDVYKFPDVLVMVRKADVSGGSEGSSVNHLGFKVRDLDDYTKRAREAGIRIAAEMPATRQAFVMTPDETKVELSEDKSMSIPIAHHHIHFFNASDIDTKAWYVKMFDAKPGRRGRFEAADLPGVNLTFSKSETPVTGTKGRGVDHIGFEIKNLEAFCKKLEGMGVKFDVPYRKAERLGLGVAFFTDPWGTYVELTEGLNRL